jgi:hypothetical protein
MRSLLSVTWRLLLAAGLVFNPVAGVGMASAPPHAASPEAAVADMAEAMPPCHDAMGASVDSAPPQAPAGEKHGCDCGDPVCHSGACCVLVALQVPAVTVPGFATELPLHAAHGLQAAAAPPPARMIRPPIA